MRSEPMHSVEKYAKRVKIRLHELRDASEASELVKFLTRRAGIIKVEVIADLFTIYITYDERVTSPGQIIADLGSIRFTPEGSVVLNG